MSTTETSVHRGRLSARARARGYISSYEAASIVGVPYRAMKEWLREGLVPGSDRSCPEGVWRIKAADLTAAAVEELRARYQRRQAGAGAPDVQRELPVVAARPPAAPARLAAAVATRVGAEAGAEAGARAAREEMDRRCAELVKAPPAAAATYDQHTGLPVLAPVESFESIRGRHGEPGEAARPRPARTVDQALALHQEAEEMSQVLGLGPWRVSGWWLVGTAALWLALVAYELAHHYF